MTLNYGVCKRSFGGSKDFWVTDRSFRALNVSPELCVWGVSISAMLKSESRINHLLSLRAFRGARLCFFLLFSSWFSDFSILPTHSRSEQQREEEEDPKNISLFSETIFSSSVRAHYQKGK